MEYKAIKWEVRANPLRPDERSIGVITLNRPDFLNAVDVRMRVELDILLDEIKHQSHIKVVILTGEGRGFSAGGDLKSEAGPLGAGPEDFDMGNFGPYKELAHYFFNDLRHSVLQRCFKKLEDLPAITIAAINGPAVGIGLEICTLVDMRFASDKARLGEVAVPAGFLPESGGARNLPKLIGVGKALDMILTGKIVDAAEAERMGLVDRLIPHDQLMAETMAYALSDFILVIMLISGLSFLSLGAAPPTAEWGVMMSEGRPFVQNAWWMTIFPGLALCWAGISLSFIAEGMSRQERGPG